MAQKGQQPQYPNENRKRKNRRNTLFAICVITAVAIVAAAVLVLMALVGRKGEETPSTSAASSEAVSSDTGSLSVSETDTSSTTETSSEAESSTAPTIDLEGTTGEATVQSSERLLVVVNNDTPMPGTFRTNLVDAFDAQIDESMVDDFEALYAAGAAEGYYYWITYSYRSAADQSTLYDNYVSGLVESGMTEEEAKEEADRTVQDGGCSEYMTGLSIGLNTANDAFGETEEYQWLIENAADYGFVLRYPSDKESVTGVAFQPWRFRYVGKEHAQKMKELNLCLEEYVQYLNGQSGTPDNGSSTLS